MARKFKFAAEIMLKLRQRREKSARQDYASCSSDIEAISHRLRTLRTASRMHGEALQQMLTDGIDAMNMRLYRQCMDDIDRSISTESRRLRKVRCDLERKAEQLGQLVTERKSLTALKDRQSQLHAMNERRREVAEWDDLYASRSAGCEDKHQGAV